MDGGGGRAMPVVKDGMMFITAAVSLRVRREDGRDDLEAPDGRVAAEARASSDFTRPEQGLPDREGVAVGDGMVFVGLTNAHAIALDEKTGKQIWDGYAGIDPPRPGQGVSGAPLYAGGLVFVGTSADPGFRGKVVAFDGKTGRKAWECFVVPDPGEAGHETWPKNAIMEGRRRRDLARRRGGSRSRPRLLRHRQRRAAVRGRRARRHNLYLCSVVALDIKTGKLQWYYQTIRHDIWEADIADVAGALQHADRRPRRASSIAAMRTDGYLFVSIAKPASRFCRSKIARCRRTRRQRTVADAAVPGRRRSRCCRRLRRVEQEPIPAGFKLGCFFAPASLDVAESADAVRGACA